MDYIKITGLKIFAHHGVLPEEKKNGQDFYINARLFYSMKQPGKTDDLNDAINYAQVCAFMTETFTAQSFDLIEAAAEHLCHAVLLEFSALEKIELELCKPHAPIGLPFTDVSVNMTRQWHKAFVAVGSNMGDSSELITNGFFTKDKDRINEVVKQLADSGVNSILLSVDAFHQETIPLEPVKCFAECVKAPLEI